MSHILAASMGRNMAIDELLPLIKQLDQRIQQLEQRVRELENEIAPLTTRLTGRNRD